MRVAATNVLPGDRVRGIGLVVTETTPENDFWTRIEGNLSTRSQDGEFEYTESYVLLPNGHLVNVVRSAENFRADRVAAVGAALTAFNESEATAEALQTLIDELHRVANMPRGQYVDKGYVYKLAFNLDGTEAAEGVLEQLDAYSAANSAEIHTISFD